MKYPKEALIFAYVTDHYALDKKEIVEFAGYFGNWLAVKAAWRDAALHGMSEDGYYGVTLADRRDLHPLTTAAKALLEAL